MGPFDNGLISKDYDLRYLERVAHWKTIEMWFDAFLPIPSKIIYSPKGSGKTTLIRSFLSAEYRKRMAEDRKILVQLCSLNGSRMQTDADVFCRLIEAVLGSLENLGVDSQNYSKYMECFQNLRQNPDYTDYTCNKDQGFALLSAFIKKLKNDGYNIVIVIDDFHQLTCSSVCAVSTFNNMAELAQSELLSYIVVTDFHLRIGSDTIGMSDFERIFSSVPMSLDGISKKKSIRVLKEEIRKKLKAYQEFDVDEDEMIEFTEDELDWVLELTAGIPGMIQYALMELYTYRQTNRNELTKEELRKIIFVGCRDLMKKWTSHLNEEHWKTLSVMLENGNDDTLVKKLEKEEDVSIQLRSTGLVYIDDNRKWKMNCPLFEEYVRQELNRPQHEQTEIEKVVDQLTKGGNNISVELNIDNSNTTTNIHNDTTVTNTMKVENVQIVQGLSASELISIISCSKSSDNNGDFRGFFAENLSEKLKKAFPTDLRVLPERASDISDAEYDYICDMRFDDLGHQILQDVEVDEDQELVNVSEEELQTLDERFTEARSRCRSDMLDSIMEQQSERCQFFLKLAVIVEDTLNFPGVFQMDDYSPQLVLYGKALEQSLRDNLYELFHKDVILSVYDTYKRKADKTSSNIFLKKKPEKTFIGDYPYLIDAQSAYLGNMCAQLIDYNGEKISAYDWQMWWKKLQEDIHKARKIRNMIHADQQSPNKECLDIMFEFIVGKEAEKGILGRLVVGSRLFSALFSDSTTHEDIDKMLQKECIICITDKKSDGRIQGKLEGCNVKIKVSKSKIQEYRSKNPGQILAAGMNIKVRILNYFIQDNAEFFSAEIIEPVAN